MSQRKTPTFPPSPPLSKVTFPSPTLSKSAGVISEVPPSSSPVLLSPLLSKVVFPSPPLSKPAGVAPTAPEVSMQNEASRKRTHLQFTLPSSGPEFSPRKKVKRVLTSASAMLSNEVQNLHSHNMLQLARASRDTFAACLRFHRLRVKEIDMMRAIAADECEQVEVFLRKADWQIGEIKHILDVDGVGLLERSTLSFGECGREPSGSDCDEHASDTSSTSCD